MYCAVLFLKVIVHLKQSQELFFLRLCLLLFFFFFFSFSGTAETKHNHVFIHGEFSQTIEDYYIPSVFVGAEFDFNIEGWMQLHLDKIYKSN